MQPKYLSLALLFGTALASCKKDNEPATFSYPAYAEASNPAVLSTAPGLKKTANTPTRC